MCYLNTETSRDRSSTVTQCNFGTFASAAFLASLITVSHGANQGARGVTLTPSGCWGVQRVTRTLAPLWSCKKMKLYSYLFQLPNFNRKIDVERPEKMVMHRKAVAVMAGKQDMECHQNGEVVSSCPIFLINTAVKLSHFGSLIS